MAAKTIRVMGLTSCAGLWGALAADEVRELEANIAESLIRGGLAVEVDAQNEPLAAPKKRASKKSENESAS